MSHPQIRSPAAISHYWLLLAVSSLGLAAVAAIVLVLARTPLLSALVPADTFPRALIVHVNLATLIWYLSMAGAMWTENLPRNRQTAAVVCLLIGAAGALGVVASGLTAPGAPILANYAPYVQNPIFLASLAGFAAAGLCNAAVSMTRPRDIAEWGFAIARWPFFMGGVYLLLALHEGIGLVDAIWGVGHILQFGFVTLMMAMWLRLTERVGAPPPSATLALPLFALAALPATIAPTLLLVGGLEHSALHSLHTQIMRWGNWPAPLLFGLVLLFGHRDARRADGFAASLGLYCAGILAGLAIDRQTTMIPAHYHGTIGAFTLAQMAAALARISPSRPDEEASKPSRRPLAIYAYGIIALICGLAWSGLLGTPRKTTFSGEDAHPSALFAGALTGIGGSITIIAIGYFVIIAIPRIVRLCKTPPMHPSRPQSPAAPTFAAVR